MRRWLAAALIAACAAPAAALELEPGKPLRLIGEAPGTPDGAPKRFVIDALVSDGDEPFQSRVEGWFASLDPADAGSGEIEGSCVQERCALSVSLPSGEFGLTGDLAGPAPGAQGQAAVKESFGDKTSPPTPVSFRPFGEEAPGLGRLAPRGAIGSHELSDLLSWTGVDLGFSNLDDEEPDGRERSGLADWQAQKGRPPSGLLLAADLAELRAEVAATRQAAGWTALPGQGWTAAYPAAVLPPAGERRFASADGKAELVYALEPPLSDEAWDALVDRETADSDDIESRSYARVNDDLEIAMTVKGERRVLVWARREGGVARMAYRYPEADEALARFEPVLMRTFRVGEDFKAAP